MPSVPLFPELECSTVSKSSIWIPEIDANGTIADPLFAQAAYDNQADFLKYRCDEFTDPASRANLLERAVFRASKAQNKSPLEDHKHYLFATYASLVDEVLAVSLKVKTPEPFMMESLRTGPIGRNVQEEELTKAIGRSEALEAMPEDARRIWERRLLGYSYQEMAEETDESVSALQARCSRGTREAIRRLFGSEHR